MESLNTAFISQIVPNLITRSSSVSSPEPTEQMSNEPCAGKPSCAAKFASQNVQEPKSSIVVSDIGTDVTTECLTDYIVDKLKVAKDCVKLALLLPTGRKKEDLNFVQYKITILKVNYGSIMSLDLWSSITFTYVILYGRGKLLVESQSNNF